MKRMLYHLLLVLAACLLLSCSMESTPDYADVTESRVVDGEIVWMSCSFSDNYHYKYMKRQFSETDKMDHDDLQRQIDGIAVKYPVDTDEEIQIYAWAFYDIAVELQLLDSEFLPYWVECYPDGIVYVMFLQPCHYDSYYDGPTPVLYFSSEDGHIIHYEIAQSD